MVYVVFTKNVVYLFSELYSRPVSYHLKQHIPWFSFFGNILFFKGRRDYTICDENKNYVLMNSFDTFIQERHLYLSYTLYWYFLSYDFFTNSIAISSYLLKKGILTLFQKKIKTRNEQNVQDDFTLGFENYLTKK